MLVLILTSRKVSKCCWYRCYPRARSPSVRYREKSRTSGTREKTQEWYVPARLISLDTRDGELANRANRELKERRWRRQREREGQKSNLVLDWQNNNFARASRFFVHFLAFVVRLRRESRPNFTFCRGREHKTTTLFFFSWTLIRSFRIHLQKKLPTFEELIKTIWRKRCKVCQRDFTF